MIIYRPTIAAISLDAVKHNIQAIQKKVGAACQVMAVVKANAYGHGMAQVAQASLEAGAARIGVATVDEAAILRDLKIKAPILVMGPALLEHAEFFIARNISAAVGSIEAARAFGRAARKLGKKARIHIKTDTGMGRFGFWWENLAALLPEIKKIRGLHLEGCFTHFATSDIADYAYTKWQHENFKKLLDSAARQKIRFDIIHAANSGAIMQHPETYHDCVRAGVMLYGMLPDQKTKPTVPIKPVMTLTTRLVEIRQHPKGRCISYGCTWQTPRASRIGILPIGYGDGYSRKFSNKGQVLIRGRRAPIVGRVCMDQTLVDLSAIPEAQIGDRVLLWGENELGVLKVEEAAKWMGTITYEVTCALGARIPRVYIK
ncbi:MAG TPA: alanine racemase [Candidatus Sumerlaeota bacterium]|nr:MAG: Alanine racemase [candidate division BRC1 bacterium ADurb.Bin183]HOE63691.1 alanine racemase [Candidatus Sumerlaeota bacterium]HRR31437.1 alanine racemase [Candidatus Sumerlaeia bacterium]HON49823.1 alanine racemase [Candidatus Sumerlaeota bacterium]HOR63929.1 alanine racemase [Candidatus Sumerlaeota bacterium]